MARDDHNGKKPRHKGSGIILRALGAIFVLVICMQFLYLPDKDERPLTVSAPLVAGSPEFMTALSRLIDAPIERGEAVTPIDDGAQFEPILLKALDAASSSIDFTTYPWANGAFSNSVFAALTRAASRGVEVRVLIDALGGHTTPNNLIAALRAAGGKVAIYHPFSILDPMQFDSRDHVRSIVVDGKVGFLGGIGIGDIWLGDGVSKGWSDMMFQVQRTMAESLQSAFAEVWNETTGEVIAGPLIYPPISAAETARETNQFIHVVSVPSDSYQPIRDTYLLSIGSAKKTLDIVNGFAVPDQGTLDMIETAAKSGIAVRMLTPGPSTYAPILRYAWEG
ncbi:MAG: hypothetical protein KGI79_01350, partial [Patescibacteria group bacterium]|nr:hypothetical protein [Patescibacteria group bacterium]